MRYAIRSGQVLAVLALGWMTAGCLETETALGPAEQAVVDPRLVGDWTMSDDDGRTTQFIVRNFNGREYYIEERAPDREVVRYAGHVVEVKGASFVHVRPLPEDGELHRKHVILRVDRVDDAKVNLRQLNQSFFEDKPHDTTAKLRAIVEQNVENASMYDGDPIALTRKA